MATTVTFTPYTDDQFITVAQLNALFASIKTVVDGKLDVRGDTVGADLRCVATTILNVPVPTVAGNLLRND